MIQFTPMNRQPFLTYVDHIFAFSNYDLRYWKYKLLYESRYLLWLLTYWKSYQEFNGDLENWLSSTNFEYIGIEEFEHFKSYELNEIDSS